MQWYALDGSPGRRDHGRLGLDSIVRWIYADATQPAGGRRYALFTCAKAKAAAMGGVARGKQNNLRTSVLRDYLLTWNQLCDEVRRFLLSSP